ncbi:ANTAR domain-containing protein [Gordonia humi]|uniref:ANTAR domain-containing protein n=2 Tax=Gordonia humi TaxID=686429 RepID=A0A840F9Q9_9ACTN|nr:hypothetical protein [Gordonia humi]
MPDEVVPTTRLLTEHKHPDDRETFHAMIERMRSARTSFSSRHRIIDTRGVTRSVIVVGRTFTEAGVVAGTEGFYLDVGGVVEDSVRGRVADHVQHFREHRAVIEQAKGMLMAVYGIPPDRAFDVLLWLSQTRNVPVHAISDSIVGTAISGTWIPSTARRAFDRVLLDGAERAVADTLDHTDQR